MEYCAWIKAALTVWNSQQTELKYPKLNFYGLISIRMHLANWFKKPKKMDHGFINYTELEIFEL